MTDMGSQIYPEAVGEYVADDVTLAKTFITQMAAGMDPWSVSIGRGNIANDLCLVPGFEDLQDENDLRIAKALSQLVDEGVLKPITYTSSKGEKILAYRPASEYEPEPGEIPD